MATPSHFNVSFAEVAGKENPILALRLFNSITKDRQVRVKFRSLEGEDGEGLLTVTRAAYVTRLPSGGPVHILEGDLQGSPMLSGAVAIRYYPGTDRAIILSRS